MLYFAEKQCDIVVLEVGLGGTLDSTNVIDPPECAVITALGMDHVKELGPTIADIASAKAGIIKPGSPVVSYGGVPEADAVIARVAAEQHAPLRVVDFSKLTVEGGGLDEVTFDFDGLHGVRLPLIGSYQPKNAAVAITAQMPRVHGMPVQIGFPNAIGIRDLAHPDYGDAVTIREGEVPVFWPCGVTPQAVVMHSKPPFVITHAPGHMFITDIKNAVLKL